MAEKPKRVQLKRTKGWRMPPNTVKVDRSTPYGNPFAASVFGQNAVPLFRHLLKGDIWHAAPDLIGHNPALGVVLMNLVREWRADAPDLSKLRGKNLACWCKPGQLCHADVLLELANKERCPMTPEQIEELEKLERAATPAPWITDDRVGEGSSGWGDIYCARDNKMRVLLSFNHWFPAGIDRQLVASVRNALPSLLSTARRASELEHKASQYDDVVSAVNAADGGRYRNDTISALLTRLGRMSELEKDRDHWMRMYQAEQSKHASSDEQIRAARETANAAIARAREAEAVIAKMEQEQDEYATLTDRQSSLLTGVVNAIRGEPEPLHMHSHHDAPELARELAEWQREVRKRVAQVIEELPRAESESELAAHLELSCIANPDLKPLANGSWATAALASLSPSPESEAGR